MQGIASDSKDVFVRQTLQHKKSLKIEFDILYSPPESFFKKREETTTYGFEEWKLCILIHLKDVMGIKNMRKESLCYLFH